MAPLSEWLELMLAEIARRQEEAQLNAEEEARRVREASAATDATDATDATSAMQSVVHTTTDISNAAEAIAPSERRRRRG